MTKRMNTWLAFGLLVAVSWPVLATSTPSQPRPGDLPPDDLGNDRSGEPVSISRHKGKVVIVTFWASWCGPCRRELPILGKLQRVVGREHLEVMAVNYKEDKREFNNVIRANKDIALTYVHDKRGTVGDRYGVKALPNMFIVGRDGKIAYVHLGYSAEMIEGFIQEMLTLLPPEVLARPASG